MCPFRIIKRHRPRHGCTVRKTGRESDWKKRHFSWGTIPPFCPFREAKVIFGSWTAEFLSILLRMYLIICDYFLRKQSSSFWRLVLKKRTFLRCTADEFQNNNGTSDYRWCWNSSLPRLRSLANLMSLWVRNTKFHESLTESLKRILQVNNAGGSSYEHLGKRILDIPVDDFSKMIDLNVKPYVPSLIVIFRFE